MGQCSRRESYLSWFDGLLTGMGAPIWPFTTRPIVSVVFEVFDLVTDCSRSFLEFICKPKDLKKFPVGFGFVGYGFFL